eukprot:scaffold928_cov370-Prasinococcus_capsulatus_cf.AAC.7
MGSAARPRPSRRPQRSGVRTGPTLRGSSSKRCSPRRLVHALDEPAPQPSGRTRANHCHGQTGVVAVVV